MEKANENDNDLSKNDHRVIGKELGLFTFSDVVGKGLPLYTDKGATIRRELERFIVDEEIRRGYKHVSTPDLAKLYRYEASGNLAGLVRVRSFCLADAHIICATNEQAGGEILKALDLITYVAEIFGLKKDEDFWYRLSKGDRADTKKYHKDDKAWDDAEELLRKVLKSQKVKFTEADNEATFYGPKIDVQMKDVRGQENTAFTVQYDFIAPTRFELSYTDKDGAVKLCKAIIHRSSIGAIERIMAFLIEHYGGAFPLWLSPIQVKAIPVRTNHNEYA